jgi:hypothetical protein
MNRAGKRLLATAGVATDADGNFRSSYPGCGARRFVVVWLMAVATLALAPATGTAAERYPTKTVRLLLRVPPGGADDMQARMLAAPLTSIWGQQVVIDNRPGAGGRTPVRACHLQGASPCRSLSQLRS